MLTHNRSRQSLKKYVKANNNLTVTDAMFDSLFNKALRNGVEKGVFEQPKGKPRYFSSLPPWPFFLQLRMCSYELASPSPLVIDWPQWD